MTDRDRSEGGSDASSDRSARVSVIIIFYNAAEYLEEAIRSVLAQDMQDFELLLVDDGSTDTSATIARTHAKENPDRIRYLHHAEHSNRGMSASRNLGVESARGEFIAFIDADDRWKRNKLREQVEVLDRHPEVAAVFGAVNYWGSWDGGANRVVLTGHTQNRPISPPEASLALYPLGSAAAPCPSDVIVRRSVVSQLGGFEESFTGPLQMYEDQAFFAKLYLHSVVYFDERNWIDYRQHDASCVASVGRAGRYEAVRRHFLLWLADYLERRPPGDPRVKTAIDRALFRSRYPLVGKPLRLAHKLLRGTATA